MTSIRQAGRSLARTPFFTAVAILSVGIGIGLATSVFTVAHAVFFAPSPYAHADRLVQIFDTERPGSHQQSDYLLPDRTFVWVRSSMRYLDGIAASGLSPDEVLESGSESARVGVQPILGDWFGTLGTSALVGRVLTPADELPAAEPAAVVSWSLWREHLGGGPDALGRVVRLAGAPYTVVGVMPRAFESKEEIWVPVESLPAGQRPVSYLGVARLRPGATVQQARNEIEHRATVQVLEDSVRWGGFGATVVPMAEIKAAGNRPALWTLSGVVGAVLLIGLSNLTTLFLIRTQQRGTTVAVRAALGASTWQLGRSLVAEALLVALAGWLLGVLLAFWGTGVAASLVFGAGAPPEVGFGSWLTAAALASLITVLLGLDPLRLLRKLDLQLLLRRRVGGVGSTRGERQSRNAMVAVQVAVTIVLLATLGVFAAAYHAFVAVDPGYDARRLVRVALDWQTAGMDESAEWPVARQVADLVRRDPAISGVALWHGMMGAWPPRPEYEAVIDGAADDAPGFAGPNRVDPGFFQAVGIPLLQGRTFTDADNASSLPVVIVTKDGADTWWPGQNPLGHRIKLGEDAPWMRVVGVVSPVGPIGRMGRDLTHRLTLIKRQMPWAFVPARQWLTPPPAWRSNADCDACEGVSIVVHASVNTERAVGALRAAVRSVAPGIPVNFISTIHDQQMHGYDANRIIPPARLAAVGSAAGLLLALMGIVGVVADGVSRRTHEIGIRMALGAPPARILGAVARESVWVGLAGVGAGLTALLLMHGVIAKRVIDNQIRSFTPKLADPLLLCVTAAVVLTLMLTATVIVARRALRVDPVEALRSE